MRSLRETFGILRRETDASQIAEAAFVLPLMFTMLLGIFWFGEAFSLYGTITRAAQEGARAGAAPACSTCAPLPNTTMAQNASAAVNAALIASSLNPNLMQTSSAPKLPACPGAVPACSGSGAACVELPVQLLTAKQGGGDCGVFVYFQYPFQMYLPFTSLNGKPILLTASAQMRIETR